MKKNSSSTVGSEPTVTNLSSIILEPLGGLINGETFRAKAESVRISKGACAYMIGHVYNNTFGEDLGCNFRKL